jgi:hypothetical protein
MKKIAFYLGIAIVVQIFILIGTVKAVPVVYTTEATWLTAVTGSTVITEDFESSPIGILSVGTTDIGEFDITIDVSDSSTNIHGGGHVNGSREFDGFISLGGTTSIEFSGFDTSPIIGFAGDWVSTITGNLLTMEMDVNGTIIKFSDHFTSPGTGFLGVVDTVAFSSVAFDVENLTSFGEFFSVDNVRLASVPEPSTMLLLGIGLVGLVGSARRKLKKKAVVNS